MPRLSSLLPLLTIAVASLAALGCSPNLRDGWYGCASTAECPSGFTCQSGRCSRGAGTECRVDLHCDDGDVCTLDVCEAGLCSREPQSGACDDGDFCNGPDECTAGVCANVGPPPCPGACDAFGCGDCGRIGTPCCAGFCAEGTCDGSTCVSCGATGEVCCLGGFPCANPGAACVDGVCDSCGAAGTPCCAGGFCDMGLTCLGPTCGQEAECTGISCPSTRICVGGACTDCGDLGEPCCADGCAAGVCNIGTGLCELRTCGGPDEPCCDTTPDCGPGLACAPSTMGGLSCQTCGRAAGQPCCPPSAGSAPCPGVGLACDPSTLSCASCGLANGLCCAPPATACPDAGSECVFGFCRTDCGGDGEPCCALRRCAAPFMCRVTDTCT